MEAQLKKIKRGRSSQNYSEWRSDGITDLGGEEPRFPALARRRHTFDAFLRTQYSRNLPAKFRQLAVQRSSRPRRGNLKRTQALRTRSKHVLRSTARMAQQTKHSAYFSRRARELKNRSYRLSGKEKAPLLLAQTSRKQAFTSVPLRTLQRVQAATVRAANRFKPRSTPTGSSLALLQLALRKRFTVRRIRDLRKAGRRRKLAALARIPF